MLPATIFEDPGLGFGKTALLSVTFTFVLFTGILLSVFNGCSILGVPVLLLEIILVVFFYTFGVFVADTLGVYVLAAVV